MPVLTQILLSTILVSLVSFVGLIFLFFNEKILRRTILLSVAFSAGALMGAAFLDLLPEAIEGLNGRLDSLTLIFIFLLLGFSFFFLLEQFIGWHHHHAASHPELKPFSYLVLVSDSLHNFIDGVIIAGSFLAGFPVGLASTLAVALHEIPQEIGDTGVLLYAGMKKSRALALNFVSAVFAVLGGLFGFFFSERLGGIAFLLPFSAGSFIYIAASDLIPQIKESRILRNSLISFLTFLLGVILIWILTILLPEG